MKINHLIQTNLRKIAIILGCVFCFNLAIAQPTYSFHPNQKLIGSNGLNLDYQSNHPAATQLKFFDNEGRRYGSVYGSGGGSFFGLLDRDNNWSYKAGTDVYTAFFIDNDEKMRIKANGNVGIGTTDPQHKLDVNGTVRVGDGDWGALVIDGKEENNWILNAHNGGNHFHIRTQRNSEANWSNYVITFERETGNTGIGTTTPQHKLDVCGTIRAQEVIVEEGWCDYVFEPEYCLTTLEEEANFIQLYGHLSNFESAKAMDGLINVNDIFKRQQIQVEENVLHLIELNEEHKVLQIQVDDLTDDVEHLKVDFAKSNETIQVLIERIEVLEAASR